MDAVTLINQNLDVIKLLTHYDFDGVHGDGDFLRAVCKLHGGKNPSSFVINQETGLWYCHSGCGGGDMFTLVQRMEGIDFPSTVQWVAKFFGIDITNCTIAERKADYLNELRKFIKMMKGKKKKDLQEYHISEEIKEVTKFRQFQEKTLTKFFLGYVERVTLKKRNGEDYTLSHRLVFPIIFRGMQIGISFRRIKSTDVPKWSHQPANIESGEILYNYDAINGESVVVCEGITDVWAYDEIGVTAVCTFGAHLTDNQYKLLLKSGVTEIILSYDGDEAGRSATDKALKMLKYKANLSVIHFNEGEDPESIDREELRIRYEQRKKL